jgi:Flp pilus assembly pilin Flp
MMQRRCKVVRFPGKDLNAHCFPPPHGVTRGAAMIDYSLIAAIVAVAGISALRAIGVKAASVMNTVAVTLT